MIELRWLADPRSDATEKVLQWRVKVSQSPYMGVTGIKGDGMITYGPIGQSHVYTQWQTVPTEYEPAAPATREEAK